MSSGGSGAAIASFGKLETKRAGHGIRLPEPKRQPPSHPIGVAAFVTDKRSGRFVVAEVFLAEVLRQQQSVSTEILDRGEEAERLDARDPASDQLTDLVRKEGGDITVDGIALRLHRAP